MELTLEQDIAILKAEVARLAKHNQDLLNTRNKLAYAAINEVNARCPGDRKDLSELSEILCIDGLYRSLKSGINVDTQQRYANRIILQRALRNGGRYWLGPGTYEIDEPITIRTAQHINLAGDPGKTFIKTASGEAVLDVQFPSTKRMSVYLHGLNLAATTGTALTHLLKAKYANGVFVTGCSGIGETYRHKLFLIQYSANIRIEDSVNLANCTVARIQNSQNIRIENIHGRSTEVMPSGWSQNADHAFVNLEFCDDWTIDRADFAGYVHGLQWWGGDGFNVEAGGGYPINWVQPTADLLCTNGRITNVTARNQMMSGVWGSMGRNILVKNFEIYRCGDVGIDAEACDNVLFADGRVEDCGWYTGGGNFGAFGLQRGLRYQNVLSVISNATIIHPEAGVNPNIPAGKPLYNHVFHVLDYVGYRCQDITYDKVHMRTDVGVSQPWMYGDVASLRYINQCHFTNFSLNVGAIRGYYREVSNATFEITQSVANGIGLLSIAVGDSVDGIGTVETTIPVNDAFNYDFPVIFGGGITTTTIPKLPGDGIAGIPGKTVIQNVTIKAKTGIAPADKNVVGITTFCFDSTGNQELLIENVNVYGCNIDINTKCTVTGLAQANAPRLAIQNNVLESGKLVREEAATGARSFLVWENNRDTSSYEVNLTNALTNVQIINLTPTSSDLNSSTQRAFYLGSLPSTTNSNSLAKVSGLVLHYSNNANNAAEHSFTITNRTGLIQYNHLKGLYALNQRSCQLAVHDGGTDPATGTPYQQLWVLMDAGFGSCIVEMPVGLQLIYEDIRPFISTSAPAGTARYNSNWASPNSWAPTSGQHWTKVRIVDPNYSGLPEEFAEIIWDQISDRPNVIAKAKDKSQKTLLYKPGLMNSTQQAAGNFSLTAFSEYAGFYERYGISFSAFMDLVVADLIAKGKIT